MKYKYQVSIAFNHGRDEQSRVHVSRHKKPVAALLAYKSNRSSDGWSPRIECSSELALKELREAAAAMPHDDVWMVALQSATIK